ncbi:AraC family transcriptional regulator [Mangrovicoccus algicola]|uniref:Helix-turn-helix transcriptional regulator n=1 Tax=Mangrovicoccus algicola TaxID=2771008 RepID=A0A8J7CV06_9RHOB|nr:helix-turn-helix transcriptional regulator [Mangrovicoccus algicola]MBE3638189.1 helix-turn-helix transcriptional regulator [Mangrovicoccus algicola]
MTKDVAFLPEAQAHQAPGDAADPARPILVTTGRLAPGEGVAPHSHARAQLVLCYAGLMRLQAGPDAWIVPPRHGVWIPPGLPHRLQAATGIEVHNFFIAPRFALRPGLPRGPVVLRGSPLLRGIARRLETDGSLPAAEARRLAWTALDEMARLDRPDLRLPGGRDPRLVRAMEQMLRAPGAAAGLEQVAAAAGCGARTLARLFLAETGLAFRDWRARMRFVLALEWLEQGETSSAVAARLGYSTPSAFIAAFRRQGGAPPSAFRRRGLAPAPGAVHLGQDPHAGEAP